MTDQGERGKTLDPRWAILLLALGLTVIRLIAGASIHLTEDEAYYRLWAQHLQLGYFDHPPMIAWWIRIGTLICGDTPLGVRLVPALAAGLNTWLIGDLARTLGASPRTAFRAALWYNATITVCLGAMLAIPDAPASLFWTVTLCCLARTQKSERAGWWLAAGLAAGLAVMSKYSALFLAPGVLLWVAATPGGLKALRKPGPWLAAIVAVVVFAPNVIWNAQNHWESFAKQFGRVAPEGLSPGHAAEFLVTQFLLLTPPIAILAGMGVAHSWKKGGWKAGEINLRLPIAASAPFAAYLLLHSLHDRVQGHWPVPLFGALAICAAAAAERLGEKPWAELVRRLTPLPGFLILAAVLVIMALPAPARFARYDPMLQLRGWPGFARDIEAQRIRTGAAWVGTQSYGVYSQLEFEGGVHAPLLQVTDRDRYPKADATPPDFARPGLIVDLSRRLKVEDVGRCFTSVTPVAEINRAGSPRKNEHYSAYLVSGPRRDVWIIGCPQEIHPGVWR